MRERIREVNRYIRHLPGSLGIVIDDRATGAVWHNANANVQYPAASTIKLAMMTDLLLRSTMLAVSRSHPLPDLVLGDVPGPLHQQRQRRR